MAKYNRRSSRPMLDLPSLFDSPQDASPSIEIDLSAPRPRDGADEFAVADEYRSPLRRLRFISFGSGSSGNCSYVGTQDTGLIIDAGVDNHRVVDGLRDAGIDIETIRGIVLTHDHADHVRYAYAILRHHKHMKLYCTMRTLEGILRRHNLSRRIRDYHSPIFKEQEYKWDDLSLIPFETSHDGTDNVGFCIRFDNTCFVLATDTGIITPRAEFYLRQATTMVIESNYDDIMLENGSYPMYLKTRIRSDKGHMDNAATARFLAQAYSPSLTHIFLCHLSEDNNTPETALATSMNSLRTVGINPAASPANIPAGTVWISALPRHEVTDLYIL
ncbi:MAG: MBL fold metallo-hydrolase [Muribaculaceae bacterium]|nr:MBL fold metallo-hydrolase [Muribaculaceae bacterium]